MCILCVDGTKLLQDRYLTSLVCFGEIGSDVDQIS
jgi:hypothetical protein